jgi:hypothetical protein
MKLLNKSLSFRKKKVMNKIENKAIRLFPKMPNAELKMDLTFVKLINLKISLSIEDSGLRK